MIYWTLRNNCPKEWEKKFQSINQTIEHHPIIELELNNNYKYINKKISQFDIILITSPFSAENIIEIAKDNNLKFYTVGDRATSLLKKNNLKVLYKANNSQELANYISLNNNKTFLHLCSEKSDCSIWPSCVETFSIYKPKLNNKFNLNSINIQEKSIIVFGSPSGIDEWNSKNINFNNSIVATMGETTKKQFKKYYNMPVITPINSSNDELCNAIYNYLKEQNNE
tara:strand:- start:27 stop:704 length:678 start_codon:yes stop_codon:yes gene_type:complete